MKTRSERKCWNAVLQSCIGDLNAAEQCARVRNKTLNPFEEAVSRVNLPAAPVLCTRRATLSCLACSVIYAK